MKKNKEIDITTVGGRIKYLRVKAALSQDELAEKLNFQDRSSISSYETNRRNVSWPIAVNMAKILGSDTNFIFNGIESEDPIATEIGCLVKSVKFEVTKKMILQQVKVVADYERAINA